MEEMLLTYHEGEDGMFYPDLELPVEKVSLTELGRFAFRAVEYLKENHKDRYKTLVRLGMLGETMQAVEEEAYSMMEFLEKDYLEKNLPQNPESTMEMWQLREQARMQAEEIVMSQIVMKYH